MPTFDEVLTTTLENRSKVIADGVSKSTGLLDRLSKKGNVKKVAGGRQLYQEFSHSENSTATWMSGSQPIDISQSNVIGYAAFDWKQAAVSVVINGLEMLQNSGSEALLDLAEERINVAESTLKNLVAAATYSDGTGYSNLQLGGLQSLVADSPSTGIVGGLNRATNSFWRNVSYDATTDGGAAASSSNIQRYMKNVYIQLVRGSEKPDLIIADPNYWGFYHDYLSGIQRLVDSNGESGFPTLKFMGTDVILDGGYGGFCPTSHMYFLNTNYLFLKIHKDRNFVVLNGDRQAVNQDAIVKILGFAGNMTMSNAFLQGVLKD